MTLKEIQQKLIDLAAEVNNQLPNQQSAQWRALNLALADIEAAALRVQQARDGGKVKARPIRAN